MRLRLAGVKPNFGGDPQHDLGLTVGDCDVGRLHRIAVRQLHMVPDFWMASVGAGTASQRSVQLRARGPHQIEARFNARRRSAYEEDLEAGRRFTNHLAAERDDERDRAVESLFSGRSLRR